MKKEVGLWIDQAKAVIFSLSNEGAAIKRVSSELENDIPISIGVKEESAEKKSDKSLAGHPDQYYDEVLSHILDAESILIFGPGEAKVELKKRLEHADLHRRIVGIETADKMTDNQIVMKVRQRFLK